MTNNLNASDSDHSSAGAGSGAGIDPHLELIHYIWFYTNKPDEHYFKPRLCQKFNAALSTYDIKTTKDAKRFEEILTAFIQTNCFVFELCAYCKLEEKKDIVISCNGWELAGWEKQDLFNWLIALLYTHKPEILTEICKIHWEKQGDRKLINIILWKAIRKGDLAQVNDALDKGANPNMWVYCFDQAYRTCKGCNFNDHRIGSENPIFHRALDLATQVGNVAIIQRLMDAGASILMQNAAKNIAIYWARNNVEVIQALINDSYNTLLKLQNGKGKPVLAICTEAAREKLLQIYPDYPSASDSRYYPDSHYRPDILSDLEDSSDSDSGSDSDGPAGAGGPSSTGGPSGPADPLDFIDWAAGLIGKL